MKVSSFSLSYFLQNTNFKFGAPNFDICPWVDQLIILNSKCTKLQKLKEQECKLRYDFDCKANFHYLDSLKMFDKLDFWILYLIKEANKTWNEERCNYQKGNSTLLSKFEKEVVSVWYYSIVVWFFLNYVLF